MTNAKTTKRALLGSVIALLVCFTMLLGTTFAWFTDSVSSTGNKIQAGNLDVVLLMWDGSAYVDISDNAAPIFGTGSIAQNNNAETLWEPGKTQVVYLAIKNNGTLDLKYAVNLIVNDTEDDKDLYKAMRYAIVPDVQNGTGVTAWTSGTEVVPGAQTATTDVSLETGVTHYFALAIHMQENAGNEYQGGQVSFDLNVLATQYTEEKDSFDNQYDKDATYYEAVTTADELTDALLNGESVSLSADLNLGTTTITIPAGSNATIDLNGHDITGTQNGTTTYGLINVPAGATLNVTGEGDVTLTANVTTGISACIFQNDGTLNIYGGNYVANQAASVSGLGAVIAVIDNCPYNTESIVNIYGGTFAVEGVGAINIIRNWPIHADGKAVLNVYDGTFKANTTVSTTYLWNKDDSTPATLNSFMNFYGGTYEVGVVYEDYNGQDDIYVAEGVTIQPYSGNN